MTLKPKFPRFMLQGNIRKRLLKAMPHILLLELRPELREQNEERNDTEDPQDTVDTAGLNTQGNDGADAGEIEANTTFEGLKEHIAIKRGVIDRMKRFISSNKINGRNNGAGMTGHVTAEDNNLRYGDDESSDSDNEGDLGDVIPLVRRNQWN